MILLNMPTTFHNSLLIKEINGQCREFENTVGKKGEVQGEKKKPYLLLRKKRKVKIYFKLIKEITSKEENWEKGNELIL